MEQVNTFTFIDQRQQRYAGFLKKKSPKGLLKAWQRRYFVLYDDLLYYFKEEPDLRQGPDLANPTGTIPLQCMEFVQVTDKKPKGMRFDVKVDGRVFELQAFSEEDCRGWVKAIQELVVGIATQKGPEMEIDTRGKFWKNTDAVRDARARTITWGDRRYLMTEEEVESTNSKPEEPAALAVFEEDMTHLRFELVDKLMSAKDHFGDVYSCKDTKTKVIYIMHVVKKADPHYDEGVALFDKMSTIRHPYVFQQVHRGQTTDSAFAVYTYALEESLFVHLRAQRRFPEHVSRLFAGELAVALKYLHSHGITFRNLRAENVFLDIQGHVVVSDLLLALESEVGGTSPEPPEYQTPEFLTSGVNDAASDWWRLGVLLYELMVGIPPFRLRKGEDSSVLGDKIRNHVVDKLRFPPFVSEDAKDCIKHLLHPEPSERLGATDVNQLFEHPFFEGLNWKHVLERVVVSPEYVDENLQHGRQQRNRLNHFKDPTKKYEIVLELVGARGLPGLQPNGMLSDPYCIVKLGELAKETKVCKDTIEPAWNTVYKFDVKELSDEISIEVYHNDAAATHAGDPVIGTVTLKVHTIFFDRLLDNWLPIVGRDAIGHGELHVVVKCCEDVERVQIEPPTNAQQTFGEVFLATVNRPSLALS